jgi:hypothetical protein
MLLVYGNNLDQISYCSKIDKIMKRVKISEEDRCVILAYIW